MNRTAILCRYISACAAFITEASDRPYYDAATQTDYLKDLAEQIDRASRHLRGYHEKLRGTGMAYWVQVHRINMDNMAASIAELVRS